LVYFVPYRDKKVVGDNIAFFIATLPLSVLLHG
jgi:hypothetical protein